MKTRFKYKFKNYLYYVMAAAIVLSLTVIGVNMYRLIAGGFDSSKIFGYITTFLISILIIVLIASILISSYYEIDEKYLTLKWGILKNQIPVHSITKTVHNPDSNKLTIVYGAEENFMVISVVGINPIDIVDALRKINKKIIFESISDESNLKDKKDKDKNNKK